MLVRDGAAISVEVDGVIIEAKFELSDGSALIWLTDNSLYDEGLHIYLIGQDDLIEDALEAGVLFGMGGPGILRIVKTGRDWVEFEFFLNGIVYRLEVAEQARLRLRPGAPAPGRAGRSGAGGGGWSAGLAPSQSGTQSGFVVPVSRWRTPCR